MIATAHTAVSFSLEQSDTLAGKIANWLMDFCQMTVGDMETTSRLHLAAHELVENVLRYGSTPTVGLEFEVEPTAGGSVVRLSTTNTAEPHQLGEVSRCIRALRAAADPVAYYDGLVRMKAPILGQSGLGLARIRAEAGLEIDFRVDGPEIKILVETTLGGEQ